MDLVGTVMGLATIPMALLSVVSVISGVALLLSGAWMVVVGGIAAFVVGLIVAALLEYLVKGLDAAALAVLERRGRRAGRIVGLLSGILPMLVVLGWEYLCLTRIMATQARPELLWFWSYGVATGPWTIFAQYVGSDQRTSCGIRAYAGHLAYWLLSALVLICHVPHWLAFAAMLLPAILPITVGTLLATADREALRNVRI